MTKSVWTKVESSGYQGVTMKGGSVAYKDACTALKTQFVKENFLKTCTKDSWKWSKFIMGTNP